MITFNRYFLLVFLVFHSLEFYLPLSICLQGFLCRSTRQIQLSILCTLFDPDFHLPLTKLLLWILSQQIVGQCLPLFELYSTYNFNGAQWKQWTLAKFKMLESWQLCNFGKFISQSENKTRKVYGWSFTSNQYCQCLGDIWGKKSLTFMIPTYSSMALYIYPY